MHTLTEYEYLDRDTLLKGVCEWIVRESPIIARLPFRSMQGNSFKYNVEVSLPTAAWTTVGDVLSENTGKFEQRTTDIYTLIIDSNTDKSAIAMNATQDPEAIDIAMAAKAMAHEFETTFIRGQTSTLGSTKQFKGLIRMIAELESPTTTDLDPANNSQVIPASSTSGALTLSVMDELMDAIKPNRPDIILCSRRARRKLSALLRASGSGVVMTEPDKFGIRAPMYDGVPILVSDFISDNLPDGVNGVLDPTGWDPLANRGTGNSNTIIFAMQLGIDKVCGLQAGEMKHEREEFLENYNAVRNRFIWYVGAACFRKYSLACIINCDPDK